nr:protein strubbelig-receptor family 5 [Quercus suber]
MAKHHPNLDLSSLVMGDVEKELLSDHPSEATTETEEATIIAKVMEQAATTTLANPVPDEQSGGNSWSSRGAHPPPPGTPHVLDQHTTKKHSGGKSVVSGAAIVGIALGVLAAIGALIALFSKRKSSPSSHFLDEERSCQSRSFTPLASQELSKDLPTGISNDFKGNFLYSAFFWHRLVDSSASIDIKTLQKSPSVGFKLPPPEFKQTYNDNEFPNLLNARKSTSLRATSYSLADLQLATANFMSGRLPRKSISFYN